MAREADVVSSLVTYLERNLQKGYKLEDLKWALVNQKHSRIEIEKAVKIIEARRPSPKKEEQLIQASIQEVKQEEVQMPKKKGFFSRLFSRD
jgi:hypothetical protein